MALSRKNLLTCCICVVERRLGSPGTIETRRVPVSRKSAERSVTLVK